MRSTTRRVILRRALFMLGAAALTVPFAASGAFAAPSGGTRSALAGSQPGWVKSAHSTGSPSSSTKIAFNVVLPLRNAAGATKQAQALTDPKSASYGHFLTPAQFNASYAPSAASVKQVENYLKGAGLSVTGVADGNRWVEASGTVKQVEAAFSTTIHNYSYRGHTLRGTTSELSIPTSLVGMISGVTGVSSYLATPTSSSVQPTGKPIADVSTPNATRPAPANCSTYYGEYTQTMPKAYGKTSFPTVTCGYGPADIRGAYGLTQAVKSGNDGRGVTVGIVDAYASPSALQDINDISDYWGEPEMQPGQYTETVFGPFDLQDECGGEEGWNIEESLDIDSVHGVAPGANIHYFGAQDCDTGLDAALNYIVQHHSVDIVSDSWGNIGEDNLGSEVQVENSIFLQGALEGIGFYFSTGDDGDNVELGGTPHPEPDFPSTDPWVTAVGGTSLETTKTGGYAFETSWGTPIDRVDYTGTTAQYVSPLPGDLIVDIPGVGAATDGAGGGGSSALFSEPWYQTLAVPHDLAHPNGPRSSSRVAPDVAMDADPETGLIIDYAGGLYQYGGTSLACPLFAAAQALAEQNRFFPIGFANPLLYTEQYLGAFHDVKPTAKPLALASTSGSYLFTLNLDTTLTTRYGYDSATGLGSVNGPAFLRDERFLP